MTTIGSASGAPEMIRKMLLAGMNVVRLNCSRGNYDDPAERIRRLRSVSEELDLPLMLLQGLQDLGFLQATIPRFA